MLPEAAPPGYAATFTLRTGARIVSLRELADGEPALVVIGGENTELLAMLMGAAERRRENGRRLAFWKLLTLHPNLVPFKVDAPGPELGAAGAGVAFITVPFSPESDLAQAFESKVKTLLRALLGSPPAFAQALLLDALG